MKINFWLHLFKKCSIYLYTRKEESKFEYVIGACSLAKTDEYETFTANDIIEPFARIAGYKLSRESLTYYLGNLCTETRSKILEKRGKTKNVRYRFRNPLMKSYAILKILQKGKLEDKDLKISNIL